jgi:hypothetical protein
MKKHSPVNIMSALLITIVALAFYSCRKELNLTENSSTDQTVVDAKDWYESSFPVNNSLKSTNAITESNSDLSQKIKPDWSHTSMYNRFGKEVIEMPIDEPTKFRSILKNRSTNRLFGRKEYNRSSYILLKQGGKYEAYIITIIADSAYLKGDLTKLAKNTYNKRDPEFSGYVLYFTPKGKYVSGWQYKNGQLIVPGDSNKGTNAQKLKTSNSKYKPLLKQTEVCVDWYWVTEDDNGQITSVTYMYSVCHYEYEADDNSGGGPSDAPPPPPRCPDADPNPEPDPDSVQVSSYKGLGVAPWSPPPSDGGGGGGFPPPEPNPPCIVPTPEDILKIKNKVKDPCLRRMVDNSINRNIQYKLGKSMNGIFNTNTKFNLTFIDGPLDKLDDGVTQTIDKKGNGRDIYSLDVQITLNSDVLPNSTEEYVTATILHEALHAYFRATNASFDHDVMAKEYIPWYIETMHSIYPSMTDSDLVGLAYGGLMRDPTFLISSEAAMAPQYDIINKSFREGRSGTGCH